MTDPVAQDVTDERRCLLRFLLWSPPIYLALAGWIADPAGYMRSGAPAYSTLQNISICLFIAAFAYLPVMIVVQLIWRAARARSRSGEEKVR